MKSIRILFYEYVRKYLENKQKNCYKWIRKIAVCKNFLLKAHKNVVVTLTNHNI